VVSRGIHHEAELETLGRMRQARGRRQGVLGRHKSGSLRFGQTDRLSTLRAANDQVGVTTVEDQANNMQQCKLSRCIKQEC
jgi:hypothetical protein